MVRPLEINLATRPFRNNMLLWAGFGSAALVLAVLSVVNGWLFLSYGSAAERYNRDQTMRQTRESQLRREEQRLSVKLSQLDFKEVARQAEFSNDAIRQRTFSWTQLFNRLEEVVPLPVMMVSIRPQIQEDEISVVVEGQSKDQEALLTFEEKMIESPFFARIYPGSERRPQRGRELRFILKFDYLPERQFPPERELAPEDSEPMPEAESAAGPTETGPSPVAATSDPEPEPVPPPTVAAAGEQEKEPTVTAEPSLEVSEPVTESPRPAPAKPVTEKPPLKSSGVPGTSDEKVPGENLKKSSASRSFINAPVQDALVFLMKERGIKLKILEALEMGGRITLDPSEKSDDEIVEILCGVLDCQSARDETGTYHLTRRKKQTIQEKSPVEEETLSPQTAPTGTGSP